MRSMPTRAFFLLILQRAVRIEQNVFSIHFGKGFQQHPADLSYFLGLHHPIQTGPALRFKFGTIHGPKIAFIPTTFELMQQYMQRAIELAKLGLGRTYPNPLVGCVIVREGKIIGEGWHRKAGEAHAEVHAINSVRDRELLADACLYVNLEPCAHQGKTPPCCDLVIEHKIPKVVIANIDPHDKVAGRGIARLKEAGTEVIVGVCASEGEQLNRRFFTLHRKKRPYVVLKWAESRDGFMDAERQPSQRGSIAISGPESRSLSHLWRSQEESILVGRHTAEVDDPLLNTRAVHGRSPAVVLIDPQRRLKLEQLRMMDAAQRQVIRISSSRSTGPTILQPKRSHWNIQMPLRF